MDTKKFTTSCLIGLFYFLWFSLNYFISKFVRNPLYLIFPFSMTYILIFVISFFVGKTYKKPLFWAPFLFYIADNLALVFVHFIEGKSLVFSDLIPSLTFGLLRYGPQGFFYGFYFGLPLELFLITFATGVGMGFQAPNRKP